MKWKDFFKSKNIDVDSDMPEKPADIFTEQEQEQTQDEKDETKTNDDNVKALKDLTVAVMSLEEANRELAVLGQQTAEVEDFDHALAEVVGLKLEDK